MAKKTAKWDATRIFILLIVIIFAVSSLALSIWVIWEQVSKDSSDPTAIETSQDGGAEDSLVGSQLSNFEPVESVESLEKIDTQVGDGAEVKPGATVTVHYTGALASNGQIFESSLDSGQPATFPLSGVIEGWTEGIPGMKVGGTRRLMIPAEQAYGSSGSSAIPPNSDLVFDVTLISIEE